MVLPLLPGGRFCRLVADEGGGDSELDRIVRLETRRVGGMVVATCGLDDDGSSGESRSLCVLMGCGGDAGKGCEVRESCRRSAGGVGKRRGS